MSFPNSPKIFPLPILSSFWLVFWFLIIASIQPILAQKDTSQIFQSFDTVENSPRVYYGEKGWHFESADRNNFMNIRMRFQFRMSYPFEVDPVTLNDINDTEQVVMQIRRARLKIGGHAFSPKFVYYMEYELMATNLLDYWALFKFKPSLEFLVGQYKVRYNTERVISSGKQQSADRSIITRGFTIDRQTGLTIFGNLAGPGALNFNYWASVLNGTGRGKFVPDEEDPMLMVRFQWNPFGEQMKFEGSDIDHLKKWRGYIAVAAVTNESPYTRFSQSGGGQLEGYPDTTIVGQYRINQFVAETAFKKRGFSWQQEFHWKSIYDNVYKDERILVGNYFQLGTFPAVYIAGFPRKMEFAARYAIYFPDIRLEQTMVEELTLSTNYFFHTHRNKLTGEFSYLELEENDILRPGWRVRLQWDISF
jgi:phosphate-selective porin OprO and OprP